MGNLEPSKKRVRLTGWILGMFFITAVAGILVTFLRYWLRKVEKARQELTTYPEADLQQFQGLSEAEVEELYLVPVSDCPLADLTGDCFVDFEDLAIMASQWLTGNRS